MRQQHVEALLANWLCSDRLDERDEEETEQERIAAANIERFEAAEAMGREATKAILLDPCKQAPDLDTAVSRYLAACGH